MWTRVKSRALHDYMKNERVIGCLKNTIQQPFVPRTGSNRILTLYVHIPFAVHPGSNSHIGTCTTLVHGSMLPLSSKQKSNGKSSSKARRIGVDNKMTLDMLMNRFYIVVQYFYITNQLISGDISGVIYKPTEVLENNCFTQTLERKLFHANKMELMNMYFIKSIKSKWARL